MDNDIVKRLREACTNLGDDFHNEAADEIERLRADIGELRNSLWDETKNG